MGTSAAADLPLVDDHCVEVSATPEVVWAALSAALDGAFSGRAAAGYAALVGCTPRSAAGPRPLRSGSSIPGFDVVSATPVSRLVLAGAHRFSTYSLTFAIEPIGTQGARLSAETRAVFPGVAGGAYRAMVIGTGVHRVGVRRLLRGVLGAAGQTAPS